MIVYLFGKDDWRRLAKKREIVSGFVSKNGTLGCREFNLESEDDVKNLKAFLVAPSLFSPKKLASISGISEFDTKNFSELLKNFIESKTTTLLISEREKPSKNFAFLLKKGDGLMSQSFEALGQKELESFLQKKSIELKISLSAPAIRLLAERFAGDTWGAVTELEKISLISKKITEKDLADLALELTPNFWQTISSLSGYSLPSRLRALAQVFSTHEPVAKIFNILAYQRKEKAPLFSTYDLLIKSGKCDYEEALLDYVLI